MGTRGYAHARSIACSLKKPTPLWKPEDVESSGHTHKHSHEHVRWCSAPAIVTDAAGAAVPGLVGKQRALSRADGGVCACDWR